ncbi:MAG: BtrH N-terminal domain-containing protein [Chloroflexi bacterium]|nr:BtrH N-terminal domain-containing protein [Chloroflexota bacterium]
MIIKNFEPFIGQHCETTATGSLLKQIGLDFSEPMLFGLGEGLSFIYWNMKQMDMPFLGGRIKPDVLTENITKHLNLDLEVRETASIKKAWENVKDKINQNIAVGVKLDCYHLDYFTRKFHFAGHYVAMYGYDDKYAYLVDTQQQGGKVKTTLKNFELARNEKGPMSSKNLVYSLRKDDEIPSLKNIVKKAIYNNAKEYLNPPIKNISYKGILKTSVEIKKWFRNSNDIKGDFQTTAMLMEKAGTGGSLFRNLYRDFLKESYELLSIHELNTAYQDFTRIADLWKKVSELLYQAGETEDVGYINQASEILIDLSERERIAMEKLIEINT